MQKLSDKFMAENRLDVEYHKEWRSRKIIKRLCNWKEKKSYIKRKVGRCIDYFLRWDSNRMRQKVLRTVSGLSVHYWSLRSDITQC